MEFRRLLMHTLRVGHPYDATHLDWHVDVLNPSEENGIYIPSGWSWGGSWILDFWNRFRDNREDAFEFLLNLHRPPVLCNTSFMLSWCYQFGVGCERNLDESRRWLRAAIPNEFETMFHLVESDWLQMIYEDDFACLGW